jgi:hypothetical protein
MNKCEYCNHDLEHPCSVCKRSICEYCHDDNECLKIGQLIYRNKQFERMEKKIERILKKFRIFKNKYLMY